MSDEITMVRGAIHNPAEPRHFMRIVPVERTVTVSVGGVEVARSTRASRVKEVGRDIYDAVTYLPRADVDMESRADHGRPKVPRGPVPRRCDR